MSMCTCWFSIFHCIMIFLVLTIFVAQLLLDNSVLKLIEPFMNLRIGWWYSNCHDWSCAWGSVSLLVNWVHFIVFYHPRDLPFAKVFYPHHLKLYDRVGKSLHHILKRFFRLRLNIRWVQVSQIPRIFSDWGLVVLYRASFILSNGHSGKRIFSWTRLRFSWLTSIS